MEEPSMPTIFEIADHYVERWAALNPYQATMKGIPGYDDKATDYSPRGAAERAEHDRRTLSELDSAEPKNESERLAREYMRERLKAQLALHDAGEYLRELNVVRPPSGFIRQVFDQMAKDTHEDWQAIAKRLRLAPEAMARYRETLDEGIRRGKTSTSRIALAVAKQAETWSGNGDRSASFFHRMIEPYSRMEERDDALASQLRQGADDTAAAYAGFATYLRDAYTPKASKVDGSGEERYRLHSRQYNGVDLDLRETYEWGWQELYRLEEEMRRTADRISPGATPQEAVRLLNTDPARAIEGVEAYRDWLQELHDQALRELDGSHFDIPDQIKTIEVRIPPPGGSLAAYYTTPAEDFSRPGRTWWPVGTSTTFPRWRQVSVAYHEGVPGHHLQAGSVRCFSDTLSRYQQVMPISGHGEGWALYAERLMGELGYLEDPEYYMGMLSGQALRAVRILVDIGLHLGYPIPASEKEHAGDSGTMTSPCSSRLCVPTRPRSSCRARWFATSAGRRSRSATRSANVSGWPHAKP
jgi:uncharacterized protein (DUF885 family)